MTQIDWRKARKGFDFHFKGKSAKDTGDFYFISLLNDRFVSETGSCILFRDMKDLPELFEISMRPDGSTWNGSGLPPVGTVCESNRCEGVWEQCKVLAHSELSYGEQVVVFQVGDKITFSNPRYFRPIRTPEQIAADNRKAEIGEMINRSLEDNIAITIAQARIVCEALHKAGYRKMMADAEEVKS